MNVNRELLAFLRKQYPVGTRIRLDSMQDPYAPVEAGTTGKLDYIDDAGQFHMKWDNGRTLALIPGVDSFTVLPPELSMTKLYMPLTAELYEPDVYGNMQEEPELLTGHDLTAYEDHIRSALVKYRMPEEVNRGIMHWYDAADSVNDKVRSVTFDVERRNGKLWGIAECQISGELSAAELTTLKEYIEGQAADGRGEGFEQQRLPLDVAASCMCICGRMRTGASKRSGNASAPTLKSCRRCASRCCRARDSSSASNAAKAGTTPAIGLPVTPARIAVSRMSRTEKGA